MAANDFLHNMIFQNIAAVLNKAEILTYRYMTFSREDCIWDDCNEVINGNLQPVNILLLIKKNDEAAFVARETPKHVAECTLARALTVEPVTVASARVHEDGCRGRQKKTVSLECEEGRSDPPRCRSR